MTAVDQLALALGAGWASGLNLYAAVLALGYFVDFEVKQSRVGE